MKFRAERLDGKEKAEGYLTKYDNQYYICNKGVGIRIKPETLEVFLFGEWRLISELETKYKLVEVK